MTEIIFTDRYGGRTISGLTACYRCDAMGCYPEYTGDASVIPASGDFDANWTFVQCPECKGTAKVGRLATMRRIPGWLVKGVRFMFTAPRQFDPEMPRFRAWTLGFKCAFLADLGLWRP